MIFSMSLFSVIKPYTMMMHMGSEVFIEVNAGEVCNEDNRI